MSQSGSQDVAGSSRKRLIKTTCAQAGGLVYTENRWIAPHEDRPAGESNARGHHR